MEAQIEKIKLPSDWNLVNPESIWKFLIAISKTGQTFNKEQLTKSGLYTSNDNNISRNLAYLKYLGVVEEERGKGKDQRFKVKEDQSVKDILYELKANREDSAKKKFRNHLLNHLLFKTLKDEFFKNDKTKTLNDLEHFLKDSVPGHNPQYYQKGGEFTIKLLNLVSLAHLNGSDITLDTDEDAVTQETVTATEVVEEENKNKLPEYTSKNEFQEVQIVPHDKYVVHFVGPGMNTKLEINEDDDLLIVEATLSKIRKKLKKNEAD